MTAIEQSVKDLFARLSLGAHLRLVFDRTRDRARQLGRPVLASLTVQLEGEDLSLPLETSLDYFLWEQAERDLSLTALGQAVRLTAAGRGRFETVRTQLAQIVADAVVEQPEPAAALAQPVCLGGFAFGPSTDRSAGEWRRFPDALVVVPRLLLARQGRKRSLTLNALIDAGTGVEAAAHSLERELSAVGSQNATQSFAPGTAIEGRAREDEKAAWLAGVRSLTARIEAGEVEKVVLARRVAVGARGRFEIAAVLDRLRRRYRSCTLFAVRSGDACFLGATPEMLVRLEGQDVRADCLAGSAARGRTAAEDAALARALLADDKEQREHALVVRGIVGSLRDVCGEVNAPAAPSLRQMANVQHLHTPIAATLDGPRHVLELVERLHPTAATAGLPRGRSLCLIEEIEPFSRGWYAGPIGWMDARGGGEFAVALRSALVGEGTFLYAGCGIVSGSDPEREYEESRLKLEAMSWALNGTH